MTSRPPRVVLDLGGLDALSLGQGQFRYLADLIRGLHELRPPMRFVVLGVRPAPVAELSQVFDEGGPWAYRALPPATGHGALYREQVRLANILWRERADLCHSLHSRISLLSPCPVVATVYDLMYELFPEYAAAVRSRPYRLHRWAVRHRVRRVICNSRTTADDAHRL